MSELNKIKEIYNDYIFTIEDINNLPPFDLIKTKILNKYIDLIEIETQYDDIEKLIINITNILNLIEETNKSKNIFEIIIATKNIENNSWDIISTIVRYINTDCFKKIRTSTFDDDMFIVNCLKILVYYNYLTEDEIEEIFNIYDC